MKIGVSSYSFAQYIRAGKMTQLDCVARAHEMGFSGIEFTALSGSCLEEQLELARKIAGEAEKYGIEIIAYTIGANLYQETEEKNEKELERLFGQLEVAKALGAPLMRHDVCYELGKSGNARSFDLMLPTIAKNARILTERAESLGIRTCTENHGFIAQDSDRVERLFNAVAHDNYGLLVDVGNFICADEEPSRAVSRVAPYAIHVHAKDFDVGETPENGRKDTTRGGNYWRATAIGDGSIPVEKCLRILKNAKYDGYVSVEYEGAEDCIEGIAKGLANLKSYIEKIEA